ncbi:DUF58 domain-containing protein [Alkalibacillus almallahensis]|uniref:DUF58 domain-containing protein n=1 Tax=Alkalibacillus almallahensis TaxID=1379154 RepID=UPI00141D7780|nr:DUF58 domain-containing protein [Alkalibacillus almallahensis]NIK11571.1 uncharacterized protein (DUF58 family) [Alkalibacillus almallahensis]
MTFQKYSQDNKTFPTLVLIGTFILFAAFFISFEQIYMLVLLAILVMLLYGMSVFYEKHVDDYLSIEFPRANIRHYQGDQGELEVTIEQKGILPLFNAILTVEMDDIVRFEEGRHVRRRYATTFQQAFNLMFWEKRTFKIPYSTEKRGVARIHHVEIKAPNMFGFGSIFMRSLTRFKQEVIVYPKKSAVANIDLMAPKRMGYHRANHSLFDDHTLPVGTRDYEPGDAFNRIHWKASAKEGNLQTKVFEKASQISWCFLVNIHDEYGRGVHENIEHLLEKTAYMMHYATTHQIPYRLFINVSSIDQIPFMHLLEGEGQKHYQRSLELLARLKLLTFTAKYERLLHFVDKHESPPAYIIHVGHVRASQLAYLKRLERRGSALYFLNEEGLHKTYQGEVAMHG